MAFYPIIKDETVMTMTIVSRSMEKDPLYLASSECPYSDSVKDYFRKANISTVAAVDLFEGKDELTVLDQQIHKVLSDLDAMGIQMVDADPSDRINYLKARTTMVEKLITMRERTYNLKELAEFRDVVMEFLDSSCTKDQITSIMLRLDGVFGVGDNS